MEQNITIETFHALLHEETGDDALLVALRLLETIEEPQQIVESISASNLLEWHK